MNRDADSDVARKAGGEWEEDFPVYEFPSSEGNSPSSQNQDNDNGGDNNMTEFEPEKVERMEQALGEMPEGEEVDQEVINYIMSFADLMEEETEAKGELHDQMQQFASAYREVVGQAEDMEEQRDFYRDVATQILGITVDYFEEDTRALEDMTQTLESLGREYELEFYETGSIKDALSSLEETAEDSIDQFQDIYQEE